MGQFTFQKHKMVTGNSKSRQLHFLTKSHLVEIVKLYLSNSPSDPGGNGFASISHKVWDTEDLGSLYHILLVLDIEVPVVGQLEWEPGVISSFHGDDVCAEVGAQKETQRFDDILFLWFTTRQGELCELFIWTKHNQLRSKDHSVNVNKHVLFSESVKEH